MVIPVENSPEIRPILIKLVKVVWPRTSACRASGPRNKASSARNTTIENISRKMAVLKLVRGGLKEFGFRLISKYEATLTANASRCGAH